jgi:hypothetical protein
LRIGKVKGGFTSAASRSLFVIPTGSGTLFTHVPRTSTFTHLKVELPLKDGEIPRATHKAKRVIDKREKVWNE